MNPFKNFQNSSMHGSKVRLCIKKRVTNGRTNGLTDERPISNMPLQFLRSWGHKKYTYSSGKFQCSVSYRKEPSPATPFPLTPGRTDGRTDERPRSNMLLKLFRSWGHKTYSYSSGKSPCSASYRRKPLPPPTPPASQSHPKAPTYKNMHIMWLKCSHVLEDA